MHQQHRVRHTPCAAARSAHLALQLLRLLARLAAAQLLPVVPQQRVLLLLQRQLLLVQLLLLLLLRRLQGAGAGAGALLLAVNESRWLAGELPLGRKQYPLNLLLLLLLPRLRCRQPRLYALFNRRLSGHGLCRKQFRRSHRARARQGCGSTSWDCRARYGAAVELGRCTLGSALGVAVSRHAGLRVTPVDCGLMSGRAWRVPLRGWRQLPCNGRLLHSRAWEKEN